MADKSTDHESAAISHASQLAEQVGNIRMLRDYHDVLFQLMGLVTDFVSPEGRNQQLCSSRRFSPFCRLIQKNPLGKTACMNCGTRNLQLAKQLRKPMVYTCHAGLVDIVFPLFVNDEYIGCLTAGQILDHQPTEQDFRKIAKRLNRLNLNLSELRRYYGKLLVMNRDKIRLVVKLIGLIGSYIVETENKILLLEKTGERDKIFLARRFLDSHFKDKISVAQAAKAVGLSPSRFSHLFKAQTGLSFVQFLNRYRVEKAQDLLKHSSLNVTEVAYDVGFQNLTHFNRIFRKLTGTAPSDLRKAEKV